MARSSRRHFLKQTLAAGAALAVPARLWAAQPNEAVRLGFISCGGRGQEHMRDYNKIDGAHIVGLCDPDAERLEKAAQTHAPQAKKWSDPRALLDDPDIDAVVVATCNHWHCLAAIWAMQAGKEVYVEKPLSHNQWEGRQTVAAAAKFKRVCQVGTQQRSDAMQAEIQKFLHEEKGLGKLLSARVNRYSVRPAIGKRETPLPIPKTLDYNLWLGPAQDKPIFRDKLQYDWHWDWNTGSGEMGNWGVHVLDDVRNNVFQDRVTLPQRIVGGGARVVWNDAGETPNVHFVWFDTGSIPVVLGVTNLAAQPGSDKGPPHPGPGSGYMVFGEGGRLEGARGHATAYDRDGKVIKEFKGTGGQREHQENFLEAVRRHDPAILHAPIQMGHDSTGWCNVANIAFRAGGPLTMEGTKAVSGCEVWDAVLGNATEVLQAHGMKLTDAPMQLSPVLQVDPASERFVGEHAEQANAFLKRQYREPFAVPEIA